MKKLISLIIGLSLFAPLIAFADATSTPVGGGTAPFCSGPLAPGWRVDMANGGCPVAHDLFAGIVFKSAISVHNADGSWTLYAPQFYTPLY